MYKTVLARVLDKNAKYSKDIYTLVTLVKLPHEQVIVYNGQLTEQQFNALKDNAAFLLLERNGGQQLPMISRVMTPHPISGFKNAV